MKSFALIATLAATAVLGACSRGSPTGPTSRSTPPSLDFSLSMTSTDTSAASMDCTTLAGDTTTVTDTTTVAATTGWQVTASGTYAVAYGGAVCFTIP